MLKKPPSSTDARPVGEPKSSAERAAIPFPFERPTAVDGSNNPVPVGVYLAMVGDPGGRMGGLSATNGPIAASSRKVKR